MLGIFVLYPLSPALLPQHKTDKCPVGNQGLGEAERPGFVNIVKLNLLAPESGQNPIWAAFGVLQSEHSPTCDIWSSAMV
jgi:hypothetical protein